MKLRGFEKQIMIAKQPGSRRQDAVAVRKCRQVDDARQIGQYGIDYVERSFQLGAARHLIKSLSVTQVVEAVRIALDADE